MLPTLLHPNEWLDGALVPSYHASLGGAETYFYQNHPVITELYRRHERGDINFVGTVATIASADNFDRERNTALCRQSCQVGAARRCGGANQIRRRRAAYAILSETARLLEDAWASRPPCR